MRFIDKDGKIYKFSRFKLGTRTGLFHNGKWLQREFWDIGLRLNFWGHRLALKNKGLKNWFGHLVARMGIF